MRFLSLVLVMYFLKLGRVCWCAGKPNVLSINLSEGSNVNSIDIAKDPGPNVAEVNNEKDNGVDGKKFNVKDSVKITLVLDNGIQIWNGGDKNCTVITVLSKRGYSTLLAIRYVSANKNGEKKEESEAYKEDGNQWSKMTEEDFEAAYESMKDPPDAGKKGSQADKSSGAGSLDLSNPNALICKSVDANIDGVPSRVLIIGQDKTVNIIMNGEKYVWMGTSGTTCSYCIVFLESGVPKMILIQSETGNGTVQTFFKYKVTGGCFGKKKESWQQTTDYIKDINNLKKTNDTSTRLILDLSAIPNDGDHYKTIESKRGDVTVNYYATNSGHVIEKVVDGSADLWNADQDTICFLCELHSKDNSKLLRLHIKSGNYQFTFQSFEHSDRNWDIVTNADFNAKLKIL